MVLTISIFKVNLNQWLMDMGYLSGNNFDGARDWKSINWAKTKAYANRIKQPIP